MSDITELDLINVTLVTEFEGARAEVPRLGLAFDEGGMTVRKADGVPYVRIPWQFITELSADMIGSQRDASTTAVALDIQSSRKRHHFVVPNVQLAALTGSLGVLSQRYGRNAPVTGGNGRRH